MIPLCEHTDLWLLHYWFWTIKGDEREDVKRELLKRGFLEKDLII